jgi:hypothetical protein
MSRQVRHRVTAVLLGGLLLGAPMVTSAMANSGRPNSASGQWSHPMQVIPTSSAPTPIRAISVEPTNPGIRPRTDLKSAIKTRTSRGTGGSAPMVTGKPPRTKKASVRRVPTLDLPSRTDPAPAAPARLGPGIAVEQVTSESLSENRRIGLLAVVSMVLVLGVSAGVIRAIVSERASRTKIA